MASELFSPSRATQQTLNTLMSIFEMQAQNKQRELEQRMTSLKLKSAERKETEEARTAALEEEAIKLLAQSNISDDDPEAPVKRTKLLRDFYMKRAPKVGMEIDERLKKEGVSLEQEKAQTDLFKAQAKHYAEPPQPRDPEFELWKSQNPDKPVSEWVMLRYAGKQSNDLIERTVDRGDKVEYIYTPLGQKQFGKVRELVDKGITPNMEARLDNPAAPKPRYVQYTAPDGSDSTMINVNDAAERAEMKALKWVPGAPRKMSSRLEQDLIDTEGLMDLINSVTVVYKPEYSGKWDSWVKGSAKEWTGFISPQEADFRNLTQSLFNQVGKLRAGAAWTAPEIQRLLGEIPNANMGDPSFKAALKNAANKIRAKIDYINKLATGTGTRLASPGKPAELPSSAPKAGPRKPKSDPLKIF